MLKIRPEKLKRIKFNAYFILNNSQKYSHIVGFSPTQKLHQPTNTVMVNRAIKVLPKSFT